MGHQQMLLLMLCASALAWRAGGVTSGLRSSLSLSSRAAADETEVTSLPGFSGKLPSKMFSGYIDFDSRQGDGAKHMYYLLVESQRAPAHDPLILWLTGGPGCSGIDAFIYEHGPFSFTLNDARQAGESGDKVTLSKNPHAWSKAATIVYVDSPVGTGLSYSDEPDEDYVTDDARTIKDLYTFLQRLLDKYPRFRDVELFIAGESYAGVYVPLLAEKILDEDRHEAKASRLRLQGYLVGNAVTDDQVDGNAQVEFAYNMALISPDTYEDLRSVCDRNYWNASRGSECSRLLNAMKDGLSGLNFYSILDPCYTAPDSEAGRIGRRTLPSATAAASASQSLLSSSIAASAGRVDQRLRRDVAMLHHAVACADRRAALAWVNRADTRTALHVRTVEELAWTPCSDVIDYRMDRAAMVPVHKRLLKKGLRVMVYSGDHDFIVPFTGSRAWIYSLGLRSETQYRPWFIKGQVAGFYERFENGLTFATVKGAGHMVPQTSPSQGLELLMRFLYREI